MKTSINRFQTILSRVPWNYIVIVLIILIASVPHAWNMFGYPYYENDEGTYMSQAWSILKSSKLAPYTYWYDHAPAGWILLAMWVKLSVGFFTFGTSVNSGRVLMLLLHIGSALFLYGISKKITKSSLASLFAVFLFSTSPLGIYYQRRVLLDNIMTFWVLASLYILLKEKRTLTDLIVSGICMGIAVLTKENAIFFIPAFLYQLIDTPKKQRVFAYFSWIIPAVSVISLYFTFAFLKKEFLPEGIVTTYPHVSLVSSMAMQVSRGDNLPFWNKDSIFYLAWTTWISKDKYSLLFGLVSLFISLILSIRYKQFRLPTFLSVLFSIFILRGKLVIDFYIIPLLPFLFLNAALVIDYIFKLLSFKKTWIYGGLFVAIFYGIFIFQKETLNYYFHRNETNPQTYAIEYIKKNLDPNATIAIDSYAYVDLHEQRFPGDPIFPNAEWVWKIERDPEIRDNKLSNDWKNITYVMLSHEILKQVRGGQFPLIKSSLNNSSVITEWKEGSTSYFDMGKYISTNGDWISLYHLKDKYHIELASSWEYYKNHYIISYGQVIDPARDNATTSEGQSYAMLRAVFVNDHEAFDGVWQWTKDHLQFRTEDKLISWLWEKKDGEYKLSDAQSASDADLDIALALILASKRWNNPKYQQEAKLIVHDIWEREVVQLNGIYVMASSSNPYRPKGYLINPSYFSPAHYRLFAEIDPDHQWNQLAEDTYFLLNTIPKSGKFQNEKTKLPPNWIFMDLDFGTIRSASEAMGPSADQYGYDAFRLLWRVSLDAEWFGTPAAKKYLTELEPFFLEKWNTRSMASVYNLDGSNAVFYNNISNDTAYLSLFTVTNKKIADEIYQQQFESRFDKNGYWEYKDNYYDQNWAWFGAALYAKKLTLTWK